MTIGAITLQGVLGQQTKLQIPMEFTISVASGESFTIPHLSGYEYNYTVDYGDGQNAKVLSYNDLNTTHTYTNAGDYTLKIEGVCETLYCNYYADRLKIKSVITLGNTPLKILQFYGCGEMISFAVGSDFDPSGINNSADMFMDCKKIVTIDLTNYITSNNISLRRTFKECREVVSIITTGWNTSNISSFESFCELCLKLVNLDVSGFDTENVLTFNKAWYYCTSLLVLDVSGFNTSKCEIFATMFGVCTSVLILDVSGFDTSKSTSFYYMFYLVNAAILDVSGFDVSLGSNFNAMFRDVNNTVIIDTSNWAIVQPNSNCKDMFRNDSIITNEAQAALFWDNQNIAVFTNCFLNNNLRSNYPLIPNTWKGL